MILLVNGISKKGFLSINIIAFVYIGTAVFGNILNYISEIRTSKMGEDVLFNIREKIFSFTQKANIRFHDKMPSGKLYTRIINDVEDISIFFKEVIVTVFKDMILIINIVGIMIYLSFKLSFMAFLVLPFTGISLIIISSILKKIYDSANNAKTKLNTFLAESIYGAKVIKLFNIQKEKQEECEENSLNYLKKVVPSSVYEGLSLALTVTFCNLAKAIIIYCSLYNIWGIDLGIGEVYIFVTYIEALFEPIRRLIENVEIIQEAGVSLNKIYDILESEGYEEDLNNGIKPRNILGKLEFRHVWFAYEGENWILKDINFVIEPGETIALVGKTGSGKTTITNLVNRFYDIQKGEILLDGINIKEINIKYLREIVGTVLQDPFIYASTIKENIKLDKDISDEKIIDAIKAASAEEFVNSLPNGILEVAQERGESFSVGQKQLIAFARIFAHDPRVFILDEATANIDTHTEALIQKSIDILSKQKTAIFIAHRLATIINVDKILVLNNGEIIESGRHIELLEKQGYYSQLYNSYYANLG